mmetsp:Transcript_31742/g.66550  ORF Transcript_31742/g.66550 Transcript_31742/m.66550 type:complete len:105 (+) Transcript_31742:1586-1900(+)
MLLFCVLFFRAKSQQRIFFLALSLSLSTRLYYFRGMQSSDVNQIHRSSRDTRSYMYDSTPQQLDNNKIRLGVTKECGTIQYCYVSIEIGTEPFWAVSATINPGR